MIRAPPLNMKVEIAHSQDQVVEIIEILVLPREGEKWESRNNVVYQVLQVTHTPFHPEVVARILVGHRNSLGIN